MKKTKVLGMFSVLSLGLLGQSSSPTLSAACQLGGNPSYPDCVDGEVTFTGSGFSSIANAVTVYVTNSANKVLDNASYLLNGGVLTFTENLSAPDTYTISVNGTVMLTVTTGSRN